MGEKNKSSNVGEKIEFSQTGAVMPNSIGRQLWRHPAWRVAAPLSPPKPGCIKGAPPTPKHHSGF